MATIEELRSRLKLGGKLSDPSKPRVHLRLKEGAGLAPPPTSSGLSTQVPASAWGMLGNDTLGDCVCAGALHGQQLIDAAGKGVATNFTTQDAINMYEVVGGYVPGQPNTDQGAELIDGLKYWASPGLGVGTFKCDAYAQFNLSGANGIAMLQQVIADFGVAYLGLEVPQSAMQQFDAGQPWTVVPRSPIEGGHCVPGVDYDAGGLWVVTWAARQYVSWAFVAKYFDEAWAVTSVDLVKAAGGSIATGIDVASANADWAALNPGSNNAAPFPTGPAPTPTPTPTPTPVGPDTDATDQALFAAVQSAISSGDAIEAAFNAWVADHGFGSSTPPHHHGH